METTESKEMYINHNKNFKKITSMNRTSLLTVAVAATILLAGCSRDESPNIPMEKDGRTALNATGGIRALSRAHDAAWDTNDQIGIFMLKTTTTEISEAAENRKYKTSDGTGRFTPAADDQTIYFPITGGTDFMAYYPWQEIAKDASDKYLYAVNVSTQSSQKAIDLLVADKVIGRDKEHPDVAFVFSHKLVKIHLTEIKHGDGLTAADLNGLTIKLTEQRINATYDVIAGGEVVVNGAGDKTDIPLLVAANSQSAEAIVLPVTSTAGMELVFTLTNGEVFRWAIDSAADSKSTQFVAGNKYSYKITISRRGLIVTSTVNDWVAGNGDNGEEGEAN